MPTGLRDAARTALLDQADAAGREAGRVVAFMEQEGATRGADGPPVLAARAVLERMRTALLDSARAGHPAMCAHLSNRAPALSFWLAYRPGKLRCAPCTASVVERVRGTRADGRCDHCRRHMGEVSSFAVMLPPFVIDLAPLPLTTTPAIQAHYELCDACRTGEEGRSQ